jgi:hypothetical protein
MTKEKSCGAVTYPLELTAPSCACLRFAQVASRPFDFVGRLVQWSIPPTQRCGSTFPLGVIIKNFDKVKVQL